MSGTGPYTYTIQDAEGHLIREDTKEYKTIDDAHYAAISALAFKQRAVIVDLTGKVVFITR